MYMKAVLEFVGHAPMKTHLLVRVDEELKKAGCDLGLNRDSLTQLSRFSSITRYPSDEGSPEELFSREDAEKALATMRQVRRCCRSALPGPSNGNGEKPGHPPDP